MSKVVCIVLVIAFVAAAAAVYCAVALDDLIAHWMIG